MSTAFGARRLVVLAALLLSFTPTRGDAAPLWSTAYYAAWMQGYLPPAAVDFSALTHVIHFSVVPRGDATLDSSINTLSLARSQDLVAHAHAAGVPAIVSVGGEGSAPQFRGATSPANLPAFVANLVSFMASRGYDGIDVDWEPLVASDAPQFTAFVTALRSALDARVPRPLMTAAAATEPAIFAALQDRFDQINLMTYSMSGPWTGWVTWFDGALYDGGYRFPSTGAPVPSADGMVTAFLSAGVAPRKLGLGIDFYGKMWSGGAGTSTGGASSPRQSWTTPPTMIDLPYYSIMDNYGGTATSYAWDGAAQAPYRSLDVAGSSADLFLSYDDESSIRAKASYARSRAIGGVMVWELGGGYRANQPAGERDPLLQALRAAIRAATTPTPAPTQPVGPAAPTPAPTAPAPPATPAPTATPPPAAPTATPKPAAPTPTATPAPWIYYDGLSSPWIDASWNASVSYAATKPYSGARSIELVTSPWAALSLRSGAPGSGPAVDPTTVQAVEFAINGGASGAQINVALADDVGGYFPPVRYGNVAANAWALVSVPIGLLDPGGRKFTRIDVRETSGLARVFYVDAIRLLPAAAAAAPTATPKPASPTPTAPAPTRTPSPIPTATPNPLPPSPALPAWIYFDGLAAPWVDSSWNATVTLRAAKPYTGSSSIQVVTATWGALSLHSGVAGAGQSVDATKVLGIELAVNGGPWGAAINLALADDAGRDFTPVRYGSIAPNVWAPVWIPMSQLNPGNRPFTRIDVRETSGTARVFFVDALRLVPR